MKVEALKCPESDIYTLEIDTKILYMFGAAMIMLPSGLDQDFNPPKVAIS